MPQTSIYLNDAVMAAVREESKRKGISLSKHIGSILTSHASKRESAWPVRYWDFAYGCLSEDEWEAFDAALKDESSLDVSLDDSCDWLAR